MHIEDSIMGIFLLFFQNFCAIRIKLHIHIVYIITRFQKCNDLGIPTLYFLVMNKTTAATAKLFGMIPLCAEPHRLQKPKWLAVLDSRTWSRLPFSSNARKARK